MTNFYKQKRKAKSFRGFSGRQGGRSFNRSSNQKSERINPAKFINKAVTIQETPFTPEHKFQDFVIHASLLNNVLAKGYDSPTPIQDKVIPSVLNGCDVVGIANTGTGKTAAFLIPLINKVIKNPKENILIITPTRELALQIQAELKTFAMGMRIFSVCCVGGASIFRQISELRYANNFIIGTPGRLKDLIERNKINLSKFNTVVLDEADQMLDMGFVNETRFITNLLPKERQTLFFSATFSTKIENLVKEFLRNPVRVSVKTRDTAQNIEQDIIKIQNGQSKSEVLHNLLSKKEEFKKVLVFGKTKHGVEKLSKVLIQKGFRAESIHGNKSQGQRQRALMNFKQNRVQVLLATDVAARGLDIDNVSHVINYDIPATYDDYVHRIGRTGRGDKRGIALTFID
jgi:superfamily II DNA/RNA helicase